MTECSFPDVPAVVFLTFKFNYPMQLILADQKRAIFLCFRSWEHCLIHDFLCLILSLIQNEFDYSNKKQNVVGLFNGPMTKL